MAAVEQSKSRVWRLATSDRDDAVRYRPGQGLPCRQGVVAAEPRSPARAVAQTDVRPTRRCSRKPGRRIGLWSGYFSPAIAATVPAGELILVDLQAEMLELARTRLVGASNARFVRADLSRLPIASGTVDTLLVVLVLGEVPERDACVAECRRILRVGGIALFAESRRDSDFISLRRLRSLVERHGFRLGERRGPSWEYTARFHAE